MFKYVCMVDNELYVSVVLCFSTKCVPAMLHYGVCAANFSLEKVGLPRYLTKCARFWRFIVCVLPTSC